jgi:glyoxylase-like metal-dependent hydrolase (beta-lactamase superfamily II)/rhodanese-related sulfurtransferase
VLFRQLFDRESSTYTYLLADEQSRAALIIDPVLEQFDRDRTLIEELELDLKFALDTHVHADHVTAVGLLRRRFRAATVASERGGAVCADRLVKHGDHVRFGQHELEVRETPGHTNGCLTYVAHEAGAAFTGDALLVRGSGRTDFQQGSSELLYRSVHEQIFSLPDSANVWPAHDYRGRTVTSVGEERRFNPRLGGGRSADEFKRIMSQLILPRPAKMDLAVPANLTCGVAPEPPPRSAATLDTSFGPVELSVAGVPELASGWVADHVQELFLLDVREPDEFTGEVGHIHGAALLPLGTLEEQAALLPRERPIVIVCRSGGRSGKAAQLLLDLGYPRVASLKGGMLEWHAQGGAVEYGAPPGHVRNRQG